MESVLSIKPSRTLIELLKYKDSLRIKKLRKDPCPFISRRQKLHHRSMKKRFYFSESKNVSPKGKSQDLPYWYPEQKKELKYYYAMRRSLQEEREKNRSMKMTEKTTYQTRLNKDILARLHVTAPEVPVLGLTDHDPEFFTVIEGRPNRKKFDRTKYLSELKNIVLTKAVSYDIYNDIKKFKDTVYKREKRYGFTQDMYAFHELRARNMMYKDFDNTADLRRLEKAAKVNRIDALNRRKMLRSKVHVLRCNIYKLEEHWRALKVYQYFLYQASPVPWRREFDTIHVQNGQLMISNFPSIYGRYRLQSLGPVQTLEELIELFEEVNKKEVRPALYFTQPKQIKIFFDFVALINEFGFQKYKAVQDLANEVRGYADEFKKIYEEVLEKKLISHRKLIESYTWFQERNSYMRELTKKENEAIKTILLSDKHITIECEIARAYGARMTTKNLKIRLEKMVKHFAQDVNEVLNEYYALPPDIAKRCLVKQWEKQNELIQADKDYNRILKLEKEMDNVFLQRVVPKHVKSGKFRSDLPMTPKKIEKKQIKKERINFYTEDIFKKIAVRPSTVNPNEHTKADDLSLRQIESPVLRNFLQQNEFIKWGKNIKKGDVKNYSPDVVSELSANILEMDDQKEESDQSQTSSETISNLSSTSSKSFIPKKQEVVIKEMITSIDPILGYPNRKVEFSKNKMHQIPFDTTAIYFKKYKKYHLSSAVSKSKYDSHVSSDSSNPIISNEDENLQQEITLPEETNLDKPNYKALKEKIQKTSQKRFIPKIENRPDINFIQSSYIPQLEIINEKPCYPQETLDPHQSIDPMFESRLRDLKQTFYKNMSFPAKCIKKKSFK